MGASTIEVFTAEEVAELSDGDLRQLAEHEDEGQRALAAEELEARAERYKAGEQRPEVDEILVDGTSQLELFDFGGKRATRATAKFTGGKVKLVAGQAFKKGDRIRFSGEAVVNVVGQKDEHDSNTGMVTDCEQRHEARIIDLQVEGAG